MARALLVIDVQNEYFTGALPITHPVGHLENILQVMDHASKYKIPTMVIRHHQPSADSPIFCKGSHEWELHPEISKRPRTELIDKTLPGSFSGTALQEQLAKLSVDTVCIAGYMTQVCCDTTARQAMHLGLKVEFLSDATGTLPIENSAGSVTAQEMQKAILCAQQMFFSEVLSSESWIARISK